MFSRLPARAPGLGPGALVVVRAAAGGVGDRRLQNHSNKERLIAQPAHHASSPGVVSAATRDIARDERQVIIARRSSSRDHGLTE